MVDPRPVTKEMLVGIVDVRLSQEELTLESAREVADRHAQEALMNPMLLSWFDRKAWKHSPAIC